MIVIKLWMIIVAIIYIIGLIISIKQFKNLDDHYMTFKRCFIPVTYLVSHCIGGSFIILYYIFELVHYLSKNPTFIEFLNYQIYP